MIDVINLKKQFGENPVLKGINVKINKGDIVVVVGPSGSGKSTFLRCLNCMEDPTSGQIIFNGVDIADIKVDINIQLIKYFKKNPIYLYRVKMTLMKVFGGNPCQSEKSPKNLSPSPTYFFTENKIYKNSITHGTFQNGKCF